MDIHGSFCLMLASICKSEVFYTVSGDDFDSCMASPVCCLETSALLAHTLGRYQHRSSIKSTRKLIKSKCCCATMDYGLWTMVSWKSAKAYK
ncbi:hypothetical protein Ancab_030046 [Ancistrocladus abbreviatus]